MEIIYMPHAVDDIAFFKKSGNASITKKITSLLLDIQTNPYNGIGKPERLKDNLSGYWSRRINKEHRIIYKVLEEQEEIQIFSLKGHYEE